MISSFYSYFHNQKHKIRERKVRTLTKNWRAYSGQAHEHTHGNKIEIFRWTRPSSDWEGWLCLSKYFNFVSMCVFVCLSTMNSSIFLSLYIYIYIYIYITQNKGKESENSTKNWRDHSGQAHKHTHGNKIEIFRQTRPSFLALFWLRKTVVSIEIFWFCFRVCVHVPVHRDLLKLLVRVFTFLSLILCFSYTLWLFRQKQIRLVT